MSSALCSLREKVYEVGTKFFQMVGIMDLQLSHSAKIKKENKTIFAKGCGSLGTVVESQAFRCANQLAVNFKDLQLQEGSDGQIHFTHGNDQKGRMKLYNYPKIMTNDRNNFLLNQDLKSGGWSHLNEKNWNYAIVATQVKQPLPEGETIVLAFSQFHVLNGEELKRQVEAGKVHCLVGIVYE